MASSSFLLAMAANNAWANVAGLAVEHLLIVIRGGGVCIKGDGAGNCLLRLSARNVFKNLSRANRHGRL